MSEDTYTPSSFENTFTKIVAFAAIIALTVIQFYFISFKSINFAWVIMIALSISIVGWGPLSQQKKFKEISADMHIKAFLAMLVFATVGTMVIIFVKPLAAVFFGLAQLVMGWMIIKATLFKK